MSKKVVNKPMKGSQAVVSDVQEPLFKRMFNKNKVTTGADNSERSTTTKVTQSKNSGHSKLIIFGVVLVFVVIGIFSGIFALNKILGLHKTSTKPKDLKQIVNIKDNSTVDQQYGREFNTIVYEVKHSNPTKWDKNMVDKAYFCLIYADKTGASTQVKEILAMIDVAQKKGINIDNNSYGIDQTARSAILDKANGKVQPQKPAAGKQP